MSEEYKEGDHSSFISYLFSQDPKPKSSITLQSPPNDPTIHPGLHIFQELLMIFVDGLKYNHGDSQGKVDINKLTIEDLELMKEYFESFGYIVKVDIFDTIFEYQFKHPDLFKNKDLIRSHHALRDFYYEIFGKENRVFRISFDTILN